LFQQERSRISPAEPERAIVCLSSLAAAEPLMLKEALMP